MEQDRSILDANVSDLLNNLKGDIFASLNCVNVGIVQSFDSARQLVSVQFALRRVGEVQIDGTRIIEEKPVLLECPVIQPYGGATYISFPISAGDECLIFFNDREIDNWFTNGGVNTPTTARMHNAADAFALVGVRSLQNLISDYLTNGIRLQHITAKIDILEDQINSVASLHKHDGDTEITGDLLVRGNFTVLGEVYGNGSNTINLRANVVQESGRTVRTGNNVNGTFERVTVVDGIVTGGS